MKVPPPPSAPPARKSQRNLGVAPDCIEVWQTCRQLPLQSPCELWLARFSPVASLAKIFVAFLDTTEHEELARLRQPADRDRMLLRRGLRRLLLARRLQCAPDQLRFARNPGGKPVLGEPAGTLHFSTASAGDWFLIGMSPAQELGVDVESPARLLLTPGLITIACSAAERSQLAALQEPARAAAFLRLWTAKEAVLKLRGTGFHHAADVRTLLENLREGECVAEVTSSPETIIHIATADHGKTTAARNPKS